MKGLIKIFIKLGACLLGNDFFISEGWNTNLIGMDGYELRCWEGGGVWGKARAAGGEKKF